MLVRASGASVTRSGHCSQVSDGGRLDTAAAEGHRGQHDRAAAAVRGGEPARAQPALRCDPEERQPAPLLRLPHAQPGRHRGASRLPSAHSAAAAARLPPSPAPQCHPTRVYRSCRCHHAPHMHAARRLHPDSTRLFHTAGHSGGVPCQPPSTHGLHAACTAPPVCRTDVGAVAVRKRRLLAAAAELRARAAAERGGGLCSSCGCWRCGLCRTASTSPRRRSQRRTTSSCCCSCCAAASRSAPHSVPATRPPLRGSASAPSSSSASAYPAAASTTACCRTRPHRRTPRRRPTSAAASSRSGCGPATCAPAPHRRSLPAHPPHSPPAR